MTHDKDSNKGQYAATSDLYQTRRAMLNSVAAVEREHITTYEDEEEERRNWNAAVSDLHFTLLAHYQQMRPHIISNYGINPSEEKKVIENENGSFYIDALDDWRLATVEVEEKDEKIGEPDEEGTVEVADIIPPEVALKCVDYLEVQLVKFDLGAPASEQTRQQPANVSETNENKSENGE